MAMTTGRLVGDLLLSKYDFPVGQIICLLPYTNGKGQLKCILNVLIFKNTSLCKADEVKLLLR